ncbi:cytochrome c oxidase subunit II [soil metagenome]
MTRVLLRLGLATALTAAAGCAGEQSVLAPGSDQARDLLVLGVLLTLTCALAYLVVLTFLSAALARRRRTAAAADGAGDPGDDARLARGLKLWIGFVGAGVCLLSVASFTADRVLARPAASPPLDVRITGHQWWWRIAYRDPTSGQWIETANELHLPLGRPVRLELTSADVIHSFWVPGLHGKLDMIPGRTNVLAITPQKAGWTRGQCGEFCGLQHAQMALWTKVEAPGAFDAWLANQVRPAQAPASPGLQLIETGPCAACHTVRGTRAAGRAGPDLTHLAARRDLAAGTLPFTRGGLAGWISQPQALKPGAEMPPSGLDGQQTQQVVTYLEALK